MVFSLKRRAFLYTAPAGLLALRPTSSAAEQRSTAVDAQLVLDGQPFNMTFREDFTEDFDVWKRKVTNWDPPPAGVEQRWCSNHSRGSFGDAQFAHWSSTPNERFPFDIRNNQLYIEVSNDYREEGKWHGGLLSTVSPHLSKGWNGFRQVNGYFEARMKVPPRPATGGGNWCAFWMISEENFMPRVPFSGQDPDDTPWDEMFQLPALELDVMEHWNREPTKIFPNAHFRSAQGGFHLWKHANGKSFDTGIDLSEDFHTYGAWIKQDEIVLYLDRQAYHTIPLHGAPQAQWCRNRAWYMLINHTTNIRTKLDGTKEIPDNHSALLVDYVRAYKEVV